MSVSSGGASPMGMVLVKDEVGGEEQGVGGGYDEVERDVEREDVEREDGEREDGEREDVEREDVKEEDNKDDEELEDKEGRKREYNRLAQREFRRRRKEKMAKLERAQNNQASEQVQEIHWLRTQNTELRRENENLKTQLYGTGWQYDENLQLPASIPSSRRTSSLCSSAASSIMESMAGDGTMQDGFGGNMLPVSQLALTSSMLPGAMQAFANTLPTSGMQMHQGMQYSMGHPAGSRDGPQGMQGGADFGNAVTAAGASFQSLTIPLAIATLSSTSRVTTQQPVAGAMGAARPADERPNIIAIVPADRVKTSAAILTLFAPLINEAPTFPHPSSGQTSTKHLQLLATIAPSLPPPFRPSATQLSTPHYYGADLLPSPSLRDRLCRAGADVAAAFLHEFDCLLLTTGIDEADRLIIWGEDPWNEVAWEFSAEMLRRWGWLVGPVWADRANFWRRQRGVGLVQVPVEAPVGNIWGMWQQMQMQMGGFASVGMGGGSGLLGHGQMGGHGHGMGGGMREQQQRRRQRQVAGNAHLQQLQQQAMSQAQQLAVSQQQQLAHQQMGGTIQGVGGMK